MLVLAATTFASSLEVDAQLSVNGQQESVSVGTTLTGGTPLSVDIEVYVQGGGGYGFPVTYTATGTTGAITGAEGGSITDDGRGNGDTSTVSFTTPCAAGAFSGTVTFTGTPASGALDPNTATATITGTVATPSTTGACAPAGDTTDPASASISINDAALWTNSLNVTVDISATDNVGVSAYRLAETASALDSATSVAVSPAEANFGRNDVSFSLTGSDDDAKTVWLRVYDAAGNSAQTSDSIGLDRVKPTSVVTGFIDGDEIVLGDPLPTVTCEDDDDRSGVATAGTLTSPSSLTGVGTFAFTCNGAVDNAGNTQTTADTKSYSVIFDWSGFFAPVENLSAWNSAKAGQSIPVKFSLDGDQGLNIFDTAAPYSGAPRIVQIACPSSATPDPIEEYATSTANSKLIYDAGQYNYVWKTDKAWAGKCFRLDVKLIDGTTHSANFKFTK